MTPIFLVILSSELRAWILSIFRVFVCLGYIKRRLFFERGDVLFT